MYIAVSKHKIYPARASQSVVREPPIPNAEREATREIRQHKCYALFILFILLRRPLPVISPLQKQLRQLHSEKQWMTRVKQLRHRVHRLRSENPRTITLGRISDRPALLPRKLLITAPSSFFRPPSRPSLLHAILLAPPPPTRLSILHLSTSPPNQRPSKITDLAKSFRLNVG